MHVQSLQHPSLCPSPRYVPWVVVNGVPMFDDFDKLKLVVCAAYGGERPDACYAPPKGPSAGELPPQARQQAPQARWWP